MVLSTISSLLLCAGVALAQATDFSDLVGTWASKSNSTLTGPGFYDPKGEKFIEPKHTGISYSFSADGHFEEAYYRAISNPAAPRCPSGIMQWQHGSFKKHENGSLTLVPIAVDGRQLLSDPCAYQNAIYTRYNTTELFARYEVITDPYHQIKRLNLFQHDESPMMPLYLVRHPTPDMLPTTTLHPLTTPTPSGTKATSKMKRSELSGIHETLHKRTPEMKQADRWWWFGVALTASGGFLYYFF